MDGKPVSDSSDVASAIGGQASPATAAEITYYRGDSKKTVTVELAKRPKSADQTSPDQGGGGGAAPLAAAGRAPATIGGP